MSKTSNKWRFLFDVMDLVFNENPRFITFKHHGLDYSVYDRDGHPTIYNIMKLAVMVRIVGMFQKPEEKNTTCINVTELLLKTGSTIFVAATDFEMSRDMYNRFVPKHELDCKVCLGNVGNYSFTVYIELYTRGTMGKSEPLVKHTKRIVMANIETRKPTALPDWFKQPLAGKGVLEGADFRVDKLVRPAKTFYKCSEVEFADLDMNNHMNYSGYPRKAVEALHYLFYCRKTSATSLVTRQVSHNSLSVSQEVWGGDLSAVHSLTEKHIQCGLKYIKICYLQEAVEGTFVYTHVWQEEHGGTEVKCSVETADGSPLCQMTLEYFQPLSKM